MEAIPRYPCLDRDAPVHRFSQPGSFQEGVGIVLSYPTNLEDKIPLRGKVCNTPKIGLSIFVLLFLPTFPSRKFSPGYRLRTGKIQMIRDLATSSPALLQVMILFPCHLPRGYARMLPRLVRCVAYQLNSICRRLVELNPGKFLDLSKGCGNFWR